MPRPKNLSRCSRDGCEERGAVRGMCQRHYDLWRRPPRGVRTKRHVMPSGYVRVWCPGHPMANSDGYALEHRKVLHDAGVLVPDGHHVHHRNGIKDDNRLENLEVLPASDHHREHMKPGAVVVNQYGTWRVLTPQERKERVRERNARRYRGSR